VRERATGNGGDRRNEVARKEEGDGRKKVPIEKIQEKIKKASSQDINVCMVYPI